jgi:hypothetical protein
MTTWPVHRCSSSSGWRHGASTPAAPSSELRFRPATNGTCGGTCANRSLRASLPQPYVCCGSERACRLLWAQLASTTRPGPRRTSDMRPRSIPKGEDAASGSRSGGTVTCPERRLYRQVALKWVFPPGRLDSPTGFYGVPTESCRKLRFPGTTVKRVDQWKVTP